MNDDLPNDADGDALRRLQTNGSDLSRPMEVDFAVTVPSCDAGQKFSAIAESRGFRTEVSHGEGKGWTCYCTCIIIPSYYKIVETQRLLDELGRSYDAKSDGWGSFGNKAD